MQNKKTQTSKELLNKKTPDGTGHQGKDEKTPPAGEALAPEEKAELDEFREIKKTTGFKKFSESAKEAMRLLNENATLREQLASANETLSEEELSKINPDYPDMSEQEKKDFQKRVKNERRLLALEAKDKMRRDYNSLSENLRKKIEEKGGYDRFVDFACSPENAGQKSLLNIAKSYLFEEEGETPVPTEDQPNPGLEEPGGGGEPPTPPKKEGEMTGEEASELRKSNPKKYNELVQKKKLKIVDE